MMRTRDLPPDPVRDAGFPAVEQLSRGVVLNCIASSFWLAAHEPVFMMEWDGDTYFEDDIQGEHWAVSFPKGGAVAVFYSSESSRNPFPEGRPPYHQSWYFRGMPRRLEPARIAPCRRCTTSTFVAGTQPGQSSLRQCGRMAGGSPQPSRGRTCTTTAWGCYTLTSYRQRKAMREWWQGMGFLDSLKWAAWSLYERRLAATAPVIPVEPQEWQAFVEVAGR